MAKKTERRSQVRLDPDNDSNLKRISRENDLKPSIAKLVNKLVRNNYWQLEVEPTKPSK